MPSRQAITTVACALWGNDPKWATDADGSIVRTDSQDMSDLRVMANELLTQRRSVQPVLVVEDVALAGALACDLVSEFSGNTADRYTMSQLLRQFLREHPGYEGLRW